MGDSGEDGDGHCYTGVSWHQSVLALPVQFFRAVPQQPEERSRKTRPREAKSPA